MFMNTSINTSMNTSMNTSSMQSRITPVRRFQRLYNLDLALCLQLNRASSRRRCEYLFAVVSRLGDGVFWYTLMVSLLVLEGAAAVPVVSRMVVTASIGLLIYKWLKTKTTRPRPYALNAVIQVKVPPLDQYSFPSGHTLHAVGFSVVAITYYPQLAWLVLPFAVLVALSRMVLGLHYPSDVAAGALLGGGVAALVLQADTSINWLFPF